MESTVDLDMGEIFDEDGRGDDDDIGAVGTLPDLPDATQGEENDEDNAEVLQRLKELSKGAAKKVVRKPQPKLDPTRLTGERGIPILPKMFEKVKFKGKGYETQDLSTIMRGLEHWGHRLFPKMTFDEVIERVEKLGSKKEVQTCVKKMRLDMPILDNEFIGSDQERDDDDDGVKRGEDRDVMEEANLDEMWDDLLREEGELRASQVKATPTAGPSLAPDNPGAMEAEFVATPLPVTPAQKLTTETPGLTPEQMERIERNKQLARERKMRKMGIFSPAPAPKSQPSLSQSNADKTFDSQSSQNVNQSGPSTSSTQSDINVPSSSKETVSHSNDKNTGTQSNTDIQTGSNEDFEMSEVIEKETSQNIVIGKSGLTQDAQEQLTEDNSMEVDNTPDTNKETDNSPDTDKEKDKHVNGKIQINTGTVSAGAVHINGDSEEMSAVIDVQDFNKKDVLKQTQACADSLVQDSSEISDFANKGKVIDKLVDAKGDAPEGKENVNIEVKGDKHRANVNTADMTEDMEAFNDELNEEELIAELDR